MRRQLTLAIFVLMIATSAFSAPVLPDLIVKNVTSAPAQIFASERFTVSFDLRNAGTAPANSPQFGFQFPSNTSFISETGPYSCITNGPRMLCSSTVALAAGESVSHTMTLKALQAGSMRFLIEADPEAAVPEQDDANNRVVFQGTINVSPSMSVTVVCPANQPVRESLYDIIYTMRNNGTLTIRNPTLSVRILVGVTSIAALTPTISSVLLNRQARSQSFTFRPSVVLAPNDEQQLKVTLRSHEGATLTASGTASFDHGNASGQCTYTTSSSF